MHAGITRLLSENLEHAAAFDARFEHVQSTQAPEAVTVCCSDSRVLQDHMWNNDEPGRLFTCSTIGNRVVQRTATGDRVVSGDILYPVRHVGTDAIIVVGHTGCGAVTRTFDSITTGVTEPPGITHCLNLLRAHLEPAITDLPPSLSRESAVNHLVEYNVDAQIQFLRRSPDVPKTVTLVGAVYDFQDVYGGRRGEVHVTTVDGDRDVPTLETTHPEIADRISRLWTY